VRVRHDATELGEPCECHILQGQHQLKTKKPSAPLKTYKLFFGRRINRPNIQSTSSNRREKESIAEPATYRTSPRQLGLVSTSREPAFLEIFMPAASPRTSQASPRRWTCYLVHEQGGKRNSEECRKKTKC
jgi:hypothetical protein